jgi:hypothetical protein
MRRISTLQNSKEGAPKNEPRLSSDSTRPVAKVKHADRKLKCADYAVEFPAEPVSQTSRRTKLLCSQKRDIVTYLCSSIPLYPLPRPTAKATLHSPRLFHALTYLAALESETKQDVGPRAWWKDTGASTGK